MSLITDRDLLLVEPSVFTAAATAAATNILTATDAAVAGTTLSSATSDFAAAGIDEAHVAVFDGEALEIIARLSATQLDISRPRAALTDAKIAPIAGSNKTLKVNTFARLIDRTQHDLLQALGMRDDDPDLPLNANDVVNAADLGHVLALRVLARAFAAAAALEPETASLADRAAILAAQAEAAAASLAVLIDTDGDGVADQTRHLNVAVLRRI